MKKEQSLYNLKPELKKINKDENVCFSYINLMNSSNQFFLGILQKKLEVKE